MKSPTSASLAVTFRCNSKCVMCDLWKKKPKEEMPAHLYRKLPSGLKYIDITGGEPFLRKNLAKIINVLDAIQSLPQDTG